MYSTMVLNSLTVAGFLLLILADFLIARGKKAGPAQFFGYLAIGSALAFLVLAPLRTKDGIGWIPSVFLILTSAASASLLLWSVFFEIPGAGKRRGLSPSEVYDKGTYSLCRHPGFWWFSFLALSLGLLKGIFAYSLTIFLMIVLDLLLIFIQDRYTFPKIFGGYGEYKKRVPFLFPRPRARESRGE